MLILYKFILMFIGNILGILGFLISNHPNDGKYDSGINLYLEIPAILFFFSASSLSIEPLSIISLQFISSWHAFYIFNKFILKNAF